MITKEMSNKFQNLIEFMSIFRRGEYLKKIWVKYFFARTISKLVQLFTPLPSTNIPSQKGILITSAKLLALKYLK